MPPSRAVNQRRWVQLWKQYAEFRRPQIKVSTFKRDYQKITNRLTRLKKNAPHLGDAIEIREYLLRHYAAETTRRTLVQLQACGRWAVESNFVRNNPWEGLTKAIRPAKPGADAWANFTAEERDRIITTFEREKPEYAAWVKFLFWTGCRPEEASALRWEHISADFGEILFKEARPIDVGEIQTTKSGKVTRFPCNPRLTRLLKDLAPDPPDRRQWVIPGPRGNHFDYHNFQNRHWKPLVEALAEKGEVAFYLPQYHCRHTWITLALEHMSPQDVSYLARVSIKVLYEHYVGRSRRIVVPEF